MRVVAVAAGAVHAVDGVAGGAGDAGLRGRVLVGVEVGLREGAGEERHRVVTAGAPAAGVDGAVAGQHHLAGLFHARRIDLVVERAEAVRAREPPGVGVLMAFGAVGVVHQRLGANGATGGGAGERRGKRRLLARRHHLAAHAQVDDGGERHGGDGDQAPGPRRGGVDALAAPAVLLEGDERRHRHHHVQPVNEAAHARLAQFDADDAQQRHPGREHDERQRGEEVADPGGPLVGMSAGDERMRHREEQERHEHDQPHAEVDQQRPLVDVALMAGAAQPVGGGHRAQIHRRRGQHGDQDVDQLQQAARPGADHLGAWRGLGHRPLSNRVLYAA